MARAGKYPEFNFLNCDLYLYFLPQLEYMKQSVLSGSIPLWNPYSAVGGPFFAANASGPLYPINWVIFLLDTPHAILAIQFMDVIIAMVGTALYMRHLKLEWPAVLLSAVLFGYVVLPDTFILHIGSTYCWLPFIILFTHKVLEKPTFRTCVGLAAVLSLCFLAGHPQYFFYNSIIAGIYALVMAVFARDEIGFKGISIRLAMVGFAFLLTLGLVAVQLLPTAELSLFSVRNIGEKLLSSPEVPRSTSSTLLMFQNYMNREGAYLSNSGFIYVPFPLYYMGCSILLVPFALLADKKIRPVTIALFAALGYSILFVLSKEIPALSVFGKIPFADSFRWHSRMNDLSQFMIVILAGIGFSSLWSRGAAWLGGLQGERRYWLSGSIIILLTAACFRLALDSEMGSKFVEHDGATRSLLEAGTYFVIILAGAAIFSAYASRHPAWLKEIGIWVVLGLIILDVASYRKIECSVPSTTSRATMDLFDGERLQWMRENGGYDRSLLMTDRFRTNPNSGSMFQLFDVNSYNPYTLTRWKDYLIMATNPERAASMFAGIINIPEQVLMLQHARLSGAASIRFFISTWNFEQMSRRFPEELRFDRSKLLEDWRLLTEGPGTTSNFYVYENTAALPRAYMVNGYQVARDTAESLKAVKSDLTDLLHSVVLENGRPSFPSAEVPATCGQVRIDDYGINEVTLSVEAEEPALVILTDSYYPGWTAYVDGVRKPIWRANSLFKAVEVPQGGHTLVFRYQPRSFRLGCAVSLIFFVAILLGILLERRLVRRSSGA